MVLIACRFEFDLGDFVFGLLLSICGRQNLLMSTCGRNGTPSFWPNICSERGGLLVSRYLVGTGFDFALVEGISLELDLSDC